MTDVMGPLYSCGEHGCASEVSYPADMLRVYKGLPYCGLCWDDMPAIWLDDDQEEYLHWRDLEPFIPEHEKRIAELEQECKKWATQVDEMMVQEAEDQHSIERLEQEVERLEREKALAIGWMYAEACTSLDKGEDIRQVEFPEIVDRLEKELATRLTGGEG